MSKVSIPQQLVCIFPAREVLGYANVFKYVQHHADVVEPQFGHKTQIESSFLWPQLISYIFLKDVYTSKLWKGHSANLNLVFLLIVPIYVFL